MRSIFSTCVEALSVANNVVRVLGEERIHVGQRPLHDLLRLGRSQSGEAHSVEALSVTH